MVKKLEVKDYIGKTFGIITIIEESHKSKYGVKYIYGQCPNNHIKVFRLQRLIRGISTKKCQSCRVWEKGEFLSGRWLGSLHNNAKNRSIAVEVSMEDIEKQWKKQNGICAISGIKLEVPICTNKGNSGTGSLDRIDSSKNYTKDNIQWIHKKLQILKWNMSIEEVLEWCRLILKYKEEN